MLDVRKLIYRYLKKGEFFTKDSLGFPANGMLTINQVNFSPWGNWFSINISPSFPIWFTLVRARSCRAPSYILSRCLCHCCVSHNPSSAFVLSRFEILPLWQGYTMWCNYIYSMEVVFANGGDQSTTPRTTAKAITSDISAVKVHDCYYYKILSFIITSL